MDELPRYDDRIAERAFVPDETTGTRPAEIAATDLDAVGAVYAAAPFAWGSVRAPWAGASRPGVPLTVVFGLHGSGRSAGSYRDVPFYRYQRDRALRSGYAFIAVSNGSDGWGTDRGLERIDAVLAMLRREAGDGCEVVPWGSSAGGAMMFRLIAHLTEATWSPLVERAIGTFPVYDLFSVFETSQGCGRAWGAGSVDELARRVGERNPPTYPERLSGCSYWIGHGVEDAIVDIERNAGRLQRDVAACGGRVVIHRAPGGHSTGNYAVYDDESLGRFLNRAD